MKLNYKTIGEGTPIFILHGLFGMLDNWMSFGKRLAEEYKVILVDHRNHGKSPRADNISYSIYAEDLNELMNDLGIDRAYVLGHSMGGKTVQFFATMFPEKTIGMISVDMGAHEYPSGGHSEIFNAILPLDLSSFERRSEVDNELSDKLPELPVRQFLLKNLGRGENGFEWKANFQVLHDQYEIIREAVPNESRYTGPSLFVRGGNSPYIRDKDMEYINKIFPNAELKTIEGAGHWVHAEKPQKLLDIVKSFLE